MRADEFAESPVGKGSPQPERAEPRVAEPTHAAILALQRTAGNQAIARWVGERASSSGWKYYSSFDPAVNYDSRREAERADRRLEAEAAQNPSQGLWEAVRSLTLYTYTHIDPRNLLPTTRQGPHTVAHVTVSSGLAQRASVEELRETFEELVLDPSEFERLVREERGQGGAKLEMNYERAVDDYGAMYQSAKRLLAVPGVAIGFMRNMIGALLNLHPYATYGWKSGKAVSQASIKGKAESGDKFNVDTRGRWTHPDRAQEYVSKLRTWWEKKRPQSTSEEEYDRPVVRSRRRARSDVVAPDPEAQGASGGGPMVFAMVFAAVFIMFALYWIFGRG